LKLKHAMEPTTDIFGIPVPSTEKSFLVIVVVHILISLSCVISGLVAMLTNKTGRVHPAAGKVYYYGMAGSFLTIIILAIMSWPRNTHLLIIGVIAFCCAKLGRDKAKKTNTKRWTRPHTLLMGFSYIFLLTGFYIDNGKNLPFWRQFPQLFFWVFPTIIGLPIILYVLKKHPLNKGA